MATILLTHQGIQDSIHTNYTGSTDTPTVGSTDWNVRLSHINRCIAEWAAQQGVEWNELWTTGGTTPTTITNAITAYALPADFNRIGGYVRLVLANGSKKPVKIIQAEDAPKAVIDGLQRVYLTGKPGAYVLNLTWSPVTGDTFTGSSVLYDYYKYPLALSGATDIPEMSNPFYIVEFVTAKLFQTQSPTNYNIHNNMSIDLMAQMMEANQLTGYHNNSPNGIHVVIGG